MIIWAIITQDAYYKLKKGSSVFCMIEDSPWGKTMSSVTGYQFVARYMENLPLPLVQYRLLDGFAIQGMSHIQTRRMIFCTSLVWFMWSWMFRRKKYC